MRLRHRCPASLPGAARAKAPVVLVHGAFVDGSVWQAVHATLSGRGFEVQVVQNPTVTLAGDVAATARVIGLAQRPVVLVGQGYGGAVITEAGGAPRVGELFCIAAFVPEAGESVADLAAHPAEPGEAAAPFLPPVDGFLIVDPARFPRAVATDVAPETTRFMAAAQVPWGLGAIAARTGRPAWKTRSVHVLVATADRIVPPSAQRCMARRAGARIVEIDSSHAAMLSHPY